MTSAVYNFNGSEFLASYNDEDVMLTKYVIIKTDMITTIFTKFRSIPFLQIALKELISCIVTA